MINFLLERFINELEEYYVKTVGNFFDRRLEKCIELCISYKKNTKYTNFKYFKYDENSYNTCLKYKILKKLS